MKTIIYTCLLCLFGQSRIGEIKFVPINPLARYNSLPKPLEIAIINSKVSREPHTPVLPRPRATWKFLLADYFKINFDGTVFKAKGHARIWVVITNENGLVIASMSRNLSLPYLVAKVEAIAVVRALEFSLEEGSKLIIEIIESTEESFCSVW